MAITSFKPSIWEKALITEFRGVSVAHTICTAPSSVLGAKAIFNVISGGTVKDYTGSVTYDDATTTPIELTYDKKKYFALNIDDCDAVQSNGAVLPVLAQEKALDMKEVVDTDVLLQMSKDVPSGNAIGTTSAKKTISNVEEAYNYIVDLGTLLSKKKVPVNGRYVVASAEYINMMAKDKRFADNLNVLPNGIVQGATINGATVIQCEEVPAGVVLMVHKSAFGFGTQIDSVEALRREGSFSDAVRGLLQYGRVAIRKDGLAALHYSLA